MRPALLWLSFASGALGCGRVAFDARADAAPDGPEAGCVTALASNGDQACALRTDGQVWCWGDNSGGQLGDGTKLTRLLPAPARIGDVIDLTSGEDTVCAIGADRSLACWGEGDAGQIGDGAQLDQPLPVSITLPAPVMEVRAGQWHTCARLADGTGYCWGDNAKSQLGSTTAMITQPSPIAAPIGAASAMTVGDELTCILRADASVACFGRNDNGELGAGSMAMASAMPLPTLVPDPVVQLAAGCHRHACAVTDRGEVWCWGDNDVGQVGTGTPSLAERVPVRVPGVEAAVQVGIGVGHSCARTRDGEVWCWGDNTSGQLGDGSFTSSLVPVRVDTPPVTLIEGSCQNMLAVRDDGAVIAWGYHELLGTGATSASPTPVVIDLPCP